MQIWRDKYRIVCSTFSSNVQACKELCLSTCVLATMETTRREAYGCCRFLMQGQETHSHQSSSVSIAEWLLRLLRVQNALALLVTYMKRAEHIHLIIPFFTIYTGCRSITAFSTRRRYSHLKYSQRAVLPTYFLQTVSWLNTSCF